MSEPPEKRERPPGQVAISKTNQSLEQQQVSRAHQDCQDDEAGRRIDSIDRIRRTARFYSVIAWRERIVVGTDFFPAGVPPLRQSVFKNWGRGVRATELDIAAGCGAKAELSYALDEWHMASIHVQKIAEHPEWEAEFPDARAELYTAARAVVRARKFCRVCGVSAEAPP